MKPRTSAELAADQAKAAVERGRDALAAGETEAAVAWLRRARRYAPTDSSPALSLAAALFAKGAWAEAATLFLEAAAACDVQEAWLGAAIAGLRQGRPAAAAQALHEALSRHVWRDNLPASLLTQIAGAAGWCAVDADDRLILSASGPVAVTFDGVTATPRRRDRALPAGVGLVSVTCNGRALLGSPVQLAAMRRTEGVVAVRDGGIEGWAWHPRDAERDPRLVLSDGVISRAVVADDASMASLRPMMRPRRFAVPAAALTDFKAPVTLAARDGTALAGSPVDPGQERRSAAFVAAMVARDWPASNRTGRTSMASPLLAVPAALRGAAARAPLRPARPAAVVIPAYRGVDETMACIGAVAATVPAGTLVFVVDDASPEPALSRALDAAAANGTIRLLRHARNRGFPAAANTGLRAALRAPGAPDIVLLNSDTVVAGGWIERLREAVHARPDIATATPFSNDASILSYPLPTGSPPPAGRAHAALARLAARTLTGIAVEVPTAVGFCMYIRREALLAAGVLREDVFAQGYGEENDLCLRMRHLGWRHVAAPAVHVAHLGGRSFGDARAALLARNIDLLNRLYPGYSALIADWIAGDPLAEARRLLDVARWRALWRSRGGATILVSHDSGGGVERCVQERCVAIRAAGGRPVLLRPQRDLSGEASALDRSYLPGRCAVSLGGGSDAADRAFPNLIYRLPEEAAGLAALLRISRPALFEVHHLLGHAPEIVDLAAALSIPTEIRVHDYAAFCPRVTLLGAGDRYCGEPDVAGCEVCVADLGNRLEPATPPRALRARSAAHLRGAARIVAPSRDAASRMTRHFPGIVVAVERHETDRYPALAAVDEQRPVRVCVVGAIGLEKGYDVLLACARDAAAHDRPLSFHLVGYSVDDERLMATGRCEITGPYREADATALIRSQNASLAFIPSIWPETWCFALGQAWQAGLPVAGFDIGAVAERIRGTGRGWLLPLGLSASRINNSFLSLPPLAASETVMQTVLHTLPAACQ